MSENSLDRGFREKLGYYSTEPSTDLWDRIDNDLERKNKKAVIWYVGRVAAVLIPITGLFFAFKIMFNKPNSPVESKNIVESHSTIVPDSTNHNLVNTNSKNNITNQIAEEQNSSEPGNLNRSMNELYNDLYKADSAINVRKSNDIENINHRESTIQIDTQILYASLNPLYDQPGNDEIHRRIVEDLDSKPKRNKTELAVGASAGPHYSSGTVSEIQQGNVNISNEGLLAYAGEMAVQLKPWRRLSIETGVFYAKQGNQTEVNAPINISQDYITLNNTTSGWERLEYSDAPMESENIYIEDNSIVASINETKEFNIVETYNIVEVPIFFKYKLFDRKLDFNLIYGIGAYYEFSRVVNKDENLIIVDNTNSSEVQKAVNLGNSFGVGMDVPLNNNFVFNVEPLVKYYFNSSNSLLYEGDSHYSLSFMMGLKYNF